MMMWQEKMKKAMEDMVAACQANGSWTDCKNCPFDTYCTALMDERLIDPYEGLSAGFKVVD